jgi:hypothetical protein
MPTTCGPDARRAYTSMQMDNGYVHDARGTMRDDTQNARDAKHTAARM